MKRGTDEIRTSSTHPLRIDWLPSAGAGRLGMTFAPGRKAWSREGFRWERDVDADLTTIAKAGTTTLVSLVEDSELAPAGIANLFERAEHHGLEVLRFPIRDCDVPRDVAALHALLDEIEKRLASGRSIVVHCIGGLGRTGTVVGCHLVRGGMPPEDALQLLAAVRKSPECPQMPEQYTFVRRFPPSNTRSTVPGKSATAPPESEAAEVLAELGLTGSVLEKAPPRHTERAEVGRILERVETDVAVSQARCFAIDSNGAATLTAGGRTYAAGRFALPSIDELRQRATGEAPKPGRVRLLVLCGTNAWTDIGALQSVAAPLTLFQVASQFNCLEAPGARIVPVRNYVSDSTQGPRAAVSAFPATMLRHYAAPAADGTRFRQTDERHLNLLADVFFPDVARVRSGYLRSDDVRRPVEFVRALTERFGCIRVGVQSGAEVVFGYDWGGAVPLSPAPRIAQAFTSTMALGAYSSGSGVELSGALRQLLRAAYLGTLLATLDLGQRRAVLTLIGGGVFGNPLEDIWQAILWAIGETERVARGDLDVIVNARESLTEPARVEVRRLGGTIVRIEGGRAVPDRSGE